jgi:dTMP kinase
MRKGEYMMSLPYDAVIFDLDGTLSRSGEGIMRSAAYALERMGYDPPDETTLYRFIGPPLVHSFMNLLHMSEADAHKAQAIYRERYNDTGLYETAIYAGIPTLLARLKRQGVYLGVATGKPQRPTERILRHFGLYDLFDRVVGIDEHTVLAGKRDLIRAALNGRHSRAVMVGDTHFDMEGAKEAGIGAIGAGYGYGTRAELTANGSALYAPDVPALSRLLLGDSDPTRGLFISMEGLDGSGKTTQAEALLAKLEIFGYAFIRTREPGGCMISEKIRGIILDKDNIGMHDMTEALLYAASRAQHVREVIRPALESGLSVFCDRYVDSSIAYQGGGRRLGVNTVTQINTCAVGGLYPDITVYLDIGHEEALSRRIKATGADRIELEDSRFHGRVQEAYQAIIARHPGRFVIVDARGGTEQVAEACFAQTLEAVRRIERAGTV